MDNQIAVGGLGNKGSMIRSYAVFNLDVICKETVFNVVKPDDIHMGDVES